MCLCVGLVGTNNCVMHIYVDVILYMLFRC
jgi:hypothetical protein